MEKIKLKCAFNNTPPIHKELLVLAPDGLLHLANYRQAYNIFTCQGKSESIKGWFWAELSIIKER